MAKPARKTRPKKKPNQTGIAPIRLFLLFVIPFLVFAIGFIPLILWVRLILYVITFPSLVAYALLPFIIGLALFILLVSEVLISGAIIRLFNIRYTEGTYEYTVTNNTAFKWMLLCQLYTPMRKILEIIPMGHMQRAYLRLLGMKIGKNSLVGGVIKDPCVTEFGDNVTMGEYAIVYGHIHNYAQGTLAIKKVTTGDNCIIGAGAILMPGAVMEENSVAGAGSLVTKNQVLEKNKVYGGNPAREIATVTKTKQKH